MEKYFIHLHNMKDLYNYHNIHDENNDESDDDGSDGGDSASVSGDDNSSDNGEDESEYGAGESDDESENGMKGSYSAFHKGFHKFYIKFEDEIKAKGGWVMEMFLKMKEEEGMNMECEDQCINMEHGDESNILSKNEQFVNAFKNKHNIY